VTSQQERFRSGCQIPHFHSVSVSASDQPPAVGRESASGDVTALLKRELQLQCFRIQILTVWSAPAVASNCPFGENVANWEVDPRVTRVRSNETGMSFFAMAE
jgi:hypothetical protein